MVSLLCNVQPEQNLSNYPTPLCPFVDFYLALMPVDFKTAGVILDDDLYDIFVKGLKPGVHVVALFDCCHSGTMLDLPYIFKANGEYSKMEIDRGSHQFNKLLGKFGGGKMLFGNMKNLKMIKKLGGGKMVNGFINQMMK